MTARDRRIIDATAAKLAPGAAFDDIVRALREATEEIIAGGRVFFLGATPDSPIFGSLVSGIGLVETVRGAWIVRDMQLLARFGP